MSDNKFARYIEQAYIAYQARQGRRVSVSEFAKALGVSQALVSHWMSGVRKPGRDVVAKVANVLGPDVYIAAGYIPDDPQVQELLTYWFHLPPEEKPKILANLRSLTSQKPKTAHAEQ